MFILNNIKFVDFSISINSSLTFSDLQYPGIFAVYCEKSNCVFFGSSSKLLQGVDCFFSNLENGSLKNQQLLKDFKFFGKESFHFFVLDCNFEYENDLKRQEALNFYKNLYSGKV